jgi:Pyruvate/2-oxoacid:ferredoxin oxidoreductase delta subunit
MEGNMPTRKIISIDEEKCNGCGGCVLACAEGAIQIIDGKARLVSDVYCDGLGACLGECPQGALTIEEREAPEFDHAAAERHVGHAIPAAPVVVACGCPGSVARALAPAASTDADTEVPSALANWPVQLHLVPAGAPYFAGADLLIAADCASYACGDFHRRFLRGKTLVIGCPKLDDAPAYREKLAEIFRSHAPRSVTVVHMEVPCCFGLVRLVAGALEDAGGSIPATAVKIGVAGEELETVDLTCAPAA